eukprot:8860223-Alexandrium_andersonii.AAC.1
MTRTDRIKCPVPETDKVLGALALTGPRRAWQIRKRQESRGSLTQSAWPGMHFLGDTSVKPGDRRPKYACQRCGVE